MQIFIFFYGKMSSQSPKQPNHSRFGVAQNGSRAKNHSNFKSSQLGQKSTLHQNVFNKKLFLYHIMTKNYCDKKIRDFQNYWVPLMAKHPSAPLHTPLCSIHTPLLFGIFYIHTKLDAVWQILVSHQSWCCLADFVFNLFTPV